MLDKILEQLLSGDAGEIKTHTLSRGLVIRVKRGDGDTPSVCQLARSHELKTVFNEPSIIRVVYPSPQEVAIVKRDLERILGKQIAKSVKVLEQKAVMTSTKRWGETFATVWGTQALQWFDVAPVEVLL